MKTKPLHKRHALRLRSKLYLSFGAVLMLGTLVAVIVLVMMQRSASAYREVLGTDRRIAEMGLTIRAGALRRSNALRGRLLHPYGDFGEQELKALAAADDELESFYLVIRQIATDPRLIETLNEIQKVDSVELDPMERQILDAIDREESAEAESLYFDKYLPARERHQKLLDQLNRLAAERIVDSVQSTQLKDREARTIAIALTVMLIVIGCALSYYLTQSFERPIKRLMQTARAIAAGDLDQKLSLERRDELGEMAEVLNQMVSHLRQLNSDLADQVSWLRETKEALTRAQGKLIQQEKMAALGQLVAGVAHELNNPIGFVYSNSILVKESIAEVDRVLKFYDLNPEMPEEIKRGAEALKKEIDYDYLVKDISQALEDCHEGARRVRDIVMNLKTFSRQDDAERHVVDLKDSVESTIRILGQYFGPDRVVLHRDYGETPRIGCYPGQLSQVWMNLLVNAAQAMNGRGEIWLTSRVEDDRAVVTLRDNGPGIPEEIITKIFDPFFTTKEVGEGTGLGLSIIHGIIERHQGEIRVDTKVGVGTTFTVKLPFAVSESSAHTNEPLGLVA